MQIEVFADIWCPFTHVGLRAVDEARRAAGRTDVDIVVRAWPLEFVNGAPMDPAKVHHHADDLRAQVSPDLFRHIAPEFPTSTIDALALVARAYGMSAAVGERASFLVRDALFEEGRNIDDPAVLADLATQLGIDVPDDADRARVSADWEEGTRRGVLGSPHFFGPSSDVFCPSLEITRDPDTGLTIRRSTDRLREFVAACVADQ
ncbi:MAG: DsbA family oxidoreductase [Ilumatobacteraceae bacterium]